MSTLKDSLQETGTRPLSWLKQAKLLSQEVGHLETVAVLDHLEKILPKKTVRLLVVGGANSGKSCLINGLAQLDLLPVSMLKTEYNVNLVQLQTPGEPFFRITEKDGVVLHPDHRCLSELIPAMRGDIPEGVTFELNLNDGIFSNLDLQIMEMSALDGPDSEIAQLTEQYLLQADIVTLVTDALMPLRRSEAYLLAESCERSVPTFIAVNKCDMVTEEEKNEILTYINQFTQKQSKPAGVFPISAKFPDRFACNDLRSAIVQSISDPDILASRVGRIPHILLGALAPVLAATEAGRLEIQQQENEIKKQSKNRQLDVESQGLLWERIDLEFEQRRQKVEDYIREQLSKKKEFLVNDLEYDLQRSNDIKAWWNRDLPYRLQRDFRQQIDLIAGNVNKMLASDMKWLKDTMFKAFKFPLECVSGAMTDIESVTPSANDVPLSDIHILKMVSRVGTVVAVITTGTLLATAGIGGLALASSLGASLAAEQLMRIKSKKDRTVVRAELDKVVEKGERECLAVLSARLRKTYEDILLQVKQHQSRWEQRQAEATEAADRQAKKMSKTSSDWIRLEEQVRTLVKELGLALKPAVEA